MSRKMKKVIATMMIAVQIITSHGVSVCADGLTTVKNSEEVVVNEDEEGARTTRPYEGEDEESEEDDAVVADDTVGEDDAVVADDAVGTDDTVGASSTSPDEEIEDDDSVVADDAVGADDAVATDDAVGASSASPDEEAQDDDSVGASSTSPDEEVEDDEEGARTTRPYEGEDEKTTVEETTAGEKESTSEETVLEDIVAVEVSKDTISSYSEILLGDSDNTITLTYNFNDKSHEGKGSTDVIIKNENNKPAETKIVKNGEMYGIFESSKIWREGYKLLGWSLERDGKVIKEDDIVNLTEDQEIYAVWEPQKYKFYLTQDILQNGVKGKDLWERSIYFTFDENIMDTIKANGLTAHTKDTKPEIYDCLEFIGWNFNGSDDNKIIGENDTFTNPQLAKDGIGGEGFLCALYYKKYIHVKLNANDLGYYLDEGAEDIEENRKKFIDLGYCEPGSPLYSLEGFKEPIPYKNYRFESWWVPFLSRPQDPDNGDITIFPGKNYLYDIKDESAQLWNEEYVAHYEEDRYPITLEAGGSFTATVINTSNIAYETGVFPDDADKYIFTNRLGDKLGGGNRTIRTIYALKGKTIAEALEEAGFEYPVAYDRTFLGWQEGDHPDRENNKYVNFNEVDFSTTIVNRDMRFTAVWKKKPLIFTFKKGPNMYFKSEREEFTIEFPARDVSANGLVFIDSYEGSLYDCQGYEDPLIIDDEGNRNDFDYEFVQWEDDEEFISDKMIFDTVYEKIGSDHDPYGWNELTNRYEGLENVWPKDYGERTHVFENGESFYVDNKGRKYADGMYGGDPYRAEPYVFTPIIRRIPMEVKMYSPFKVFSFDKNRQDLVIGSGTEIGSIDEFNSTDFSKVKSDGYNFAGWYQIDHTKINETLLDFSTTGSKHYGIPPVSVDDIEEYVDKGMPTIAGFAKPGLDTWFKYVQCTRTDDLNYAAGQWLKKIDGDLVINRNSAVVRSHYSNFRSKETVKQFCALDLVAIFTANLTLDAGDGHFADNSKEKVIKNILIDTITPIKEYKGMGYEVPTPSDANKVFAGWRLVDADGNDVRYFNEYEAISKDTRLVASYMNSKGSIKLTLKLHGAETIEETKDGNGNPVFNVVEMPDVVLTVPQGVLVAEIEKDIPSFTRNGYLYDPLITNSPAWYYEYKDGEYSRDVRLEHALHEDTIIHLKWKKRNYSYMFFYYVDGEERLGGSIYGEFGQALKDCDLYQNSSDIRNLFDFGLENKPEKGYKITAINMFGENGKEITPDTEIEGNIRCKLTVEPLNTTITFDPNGGELIGDATMTVPYATYYKDIKHIIPRASRSDMSFVGWIDDKGEQVTDKYRIATSYAEDKVKQVKLTAQWTDIKATLVFDAGEGKFKDDSKKKIFENIPHLQLLSNIKDGERTYEEPTLEGKVFDRWEVTLTKQLNIEYTRDNRFGDAIHSIDEEIKSEIVLKALYVDKTVTFSVKLTDPSNSLGAVTFIRDPNVTGPKLPIDYVVSIVTMFNGGYASGNTWVQTVKEGMTFGQWFKYMEENGWRYKEEYGYVLCGWKYEEPATIEAPRKKTFDMKDVDMNAPIKDGDVFTALMAKGNFTVRIDANGGTYSKVSDRETSSGVSIHQDSSTLMVYGNVPGGTAADKIDGMIMPRKEGYTLVGYSRKQNLSGKILASNVFIAGEEYLYAIWSENGNQHVQPSVNKDTNTNSSPGNSGGGTGGTNGTGPLQNVNQPRTDIVANIGPQAPVAADAPKQFTQTNVSEEVKQKSEAQVNQVIVAAGLSASAANNSRVQEAVAEVQAGITIAEQYAQIVSQMTANPSAVRPTTEVSYENLAANQAYWHTDANGNVTLESAQYGLYGSVKNVWQAVTNEAGQTGWYKFDANGYMQTGLVQDGAYTYYLSEERGAGYGQMICNQTITIGGLTMTFNSVGALTNMQYSADAAIKAIQDAATAPTTQTTEQAIYTVPAGPELTQEGLQSTAGFPQLTPTTQQLTPVVPQLTPTVPQLTPTVPQLTPAVPQLTPAGPREIGNQVKIQQILYTKLADSQYV